MITTLLPDILRLLDSYITVGCPDGDVVGVIEGDIVGDLDGELLGPNVGLTIGCTDGDVQLWNPPRMYAFTIAVIVSAIRGQSTVSVNSWGPKHTTSTGVALGPANSVAAADNALAVFSHASELSTFGLSASLLQLSVSNDASTGVHTPKISLMKSVLILIDQHTASC